MTKPINEGTKSVSAMEYLNLAEEENKSAANDEDDKS